MTATLVLPGDAPDLGVKLALALDDWLSAGPKS